MENINYFDVIVLALILILGLKGLVRGFINEAFALIGIVAGVYFASSYAEQVGEFISLNFIPIEGENTLLLIGFVITIVVVWLATYILGNMVRQIFSLSGLGIFDSILGFIFGAAKVFFIFSIIVYALSRVDFISDKLKEVTKGSVVYPILKEAGDNIIKLDPKQLKDKITNTFTKSVDEIRKFDEKISETTKSNDELNK